MIKLSPKPESVYTCPFDNAVMDVLDWHIPGMRVLALMECPKCHREFYADLPVGQALYSPMLLDKGTGQITDPNQVTWFSYWLKKGFRSRSSAQIKFTIHQVKPSHTRSKIVILNCLDVLYGHCVLKLLNAQYYLDHCPEMDLIVMVPTFLKWMVPHGVSAIWEVDWPLKTGYQWNDWLAQKIKELMAEYDEVFVSVAYSHPHPENYDIGRFVGVQPFMQSDWEKKITNPRITFIWREDRLWTPRMKKFSFPWRNRLREQAELVAALAGQLKLKIPGLEFVVAGLGCKEKLPDWIVDLRTDVISETQERKWCKLYSESHLVIGVHGSNMLLPSSLAGSVIDLMPNKRWKNVLQDVLFRPMDMREAMYRYRFIPISIDSIELSNMVFYMFDAHKFMLMTLPKQASDHVF